MIIKDPLNPFHADFFTTHLHLHAHAAVGAKAFPRDQFSIKTVIPLSGCDPLIGMRSMTCSDFTAFSLMFRTGPFLSEIGKYSNGASSVTTKLNVDPDTVISVHAKSPGFDDTSSSRISGDRRFQLGKKLQGAMHMAIDIADLGNPDPFLTLGGSVEMRQYFHVISQVNRESLSLGVKFQPCGHMHAGIGMDFDLSRKIFRDIQSSLYFETHAGGTVGVLGTLSIDKQRQSSLLLCGTTQIQLWDQPAQSTSGDAEVLSVPNPVMGFDYDVFHDRASGYVDLKILAAAPKKSSVNLSVKMGFTTVSWRNPIFGMHLNASEK